MKRVLALALCTCFLVACSKPTIAPTPTPTIAIPIQVPPEPPKPVTLKGPIYLLATPLHPIMPGPVLVSVENSPQARPQSGYAEADLVVEALAEAEISRTLAFYWSKPAPKIGPVRSARTAFVSLANAYGAPFGHAGGNDDALLMIRQTATKSLDEILGKATAFFWRSADRSAPHNLYTSTDLMKAGAAAKGYQTVPVPTSVRQAAPFPTTGGVTRVDLVWHRLHKLFWVWDGSTYRRTEQEGPHRDDQGNLLQAPNLVFLQVGGETYSSEASWTLYMDKGGKATVIAGGQLWEGSWKLGPGGLVLEPTSGEVPPFVPGAVWVHMVTDHSAFTLTKN
jgi:hypothetical protein